MNKGRLANIYKYEKLENVELSLWKSISITVILFLMALIKAWANWMQLRAYEPRYAICVRTLLVSLLFIFLLYFLGDVFNLVGKQTVCKDGKLIFAGTTKGKAFSHKLGDVLRILLFVGAVVGSAAVLATKDFDAIFSLAISWALWLTLGFVARRGVRKTYVSLLIAVLLIAVY